MVYKKKFNPFSKKLDYVWNNSDVTKEPTGFTDPESITVSYDSTTRKITLTGTVEAYFKGNKVLALTDGWVSDAHTDSANIYFLYYNGTSFVWSTTAWTFDMLQIAFVSYDGITFGIREVHGLMGYQTHEELHNTIGTYLVSGGDLSNYALASTTAGDRRPDVSSTHIADEDLHTTNGALTSNSYSVFYLSSTDTANIDISQTDIVPLSGANPYYNQFTGGAWQQTLLSTTNYMCVWLVAIPNTADSQSQNYRYVWVQGQEAFTSLASAQGKTTGNISLGTLTNLTPELIFIGKIIIRYIGGNWQLIQVDKLTGTRTNQTSAPAGNYLSVVATDSTLSGDGTSGNPLSVTGVAVNIVETTAITYNASITDGFIKADCTSNAITVNLPTAVGNDGSVLDIKKVDSTTNTVTVETNSTETIDGSDGIEIINQYDNYTILSDGSNWVIR